jgi:hypothetical protein
MKAPQKGAFFFFHDQWITPGVKGRRCQGMTSFFMDHLTMSGEEAF